MPKEANIFIADDNQSFLELLEFYIRRGKHKVVACASDLDDALSIISKFKELGVEVAVLDANLDQYGSGGSDGIRMVNEIKLKFPMVKIVGCSSNDFPIEVDADLGLEVGNIAETINNL